MIFDVIVGALALGAIAIMGVEKASDVADSIKNNGLSETVKTESKKAANYVKKEYERKQKIANRKK